ncbi:MAG: autotransporter-associated beta strand repeat-containing protein [Isosphaeraceae bacterium]
MLALFPGRDSSLQNGSATRSRSLRRSRTGLRPRIETLEEKLAPAVYVWTGAVDALMSNPANWSTAGAPASAAPDGDDDLVFSSAGAIKAVSNDLDNAAFQSVQFQDPGYVLSGHDFTLQNAISASQNATIAAGITLDPGPLNAFVAPWVQLKIEGALTGPGSLVKTGQGTLTLYAASSYAGATHLQAGMLLAGVANVLPASTALTVDDGAAFNLWNHDQRIGSLAGGTSNVDLGSATLTVGDATDTVYNGMLTGPGGSLVKVGTGSLTLTYFSTYNGPTRVAEGTLRIDGSIEPTPTLVVEAGATLSGRGSIGSILVAGTVIPGDASNRGSLFVKNATFLPGSRYMVNITGPNAGPSYGVLSVSGTADFSGATLQLASPYDGSPLTIVRNDGDIPFTTSFNGLSDGSTSRCWAGPTCSTTTKRWATGRTTP